ncbi:MAG: F0F1 ATP synthase subunit A [Armatimonadetes bacterium]|nr:F0F1 ATP synthase subunit A [Armatimonadota bacterium]
MHEHPGTWINAIVHLEPESLRHILDANSITALMVLLCVVIFVRVGTRNLRLRPTSGGQIFWEWAYESFVGFCEDVIGPGGAKYAPFLGTLFIYITALNLLGVVPGFLSPTASLNMTFALSLTTIVYVQYCGFKSQGIRYLMHFVGEPKALFLLNIPIHVIGELARPLSLAVRLFGNIFGEDVIIAQLLLMAAAIYAKIYIPIPLHFPMVLFHIFVSFVQALVFMMLSAAYIAGATAGHGDDHGDAHGHEHSPEAA